MKALFITLEELKRNISRNSIAIADIDRNITKDESVISEDTTITQKTDTDNKTKNNKNNKKKKKKNSLSGFAIPSKITKELADFLGLDENIEIPRTDVTKLICKYIKDNHLQNPENKKIIIPDEKFKKLFEGQLDENNKLEFFNIQTYLNAIL